MITIRLEAESSCAGGTSKQVEQKLIAVVWFRPFASSHSHPTRPSMPFCNFRAAILSLAAKAF